jgi:hypothetical protein
MTRSSETPDQRRLAALVEDLSRSMQRSLLDAVLNVGPDTEATRTTVPRARIPTAPAWLASRHPGGERAGAEMKAMYERCLTHYREIVCAGAASTGYDDVGALLAHFVAVNFAALRDIDITPAMLERLQAQLGGILRLSPAWLRADLRERQCYVEQLAIIGVLVRETSAQAAIEGPAAVANVQRAARGYLMQLIGLDADRLRLDDDGLAFAGRGQPSPAVAA